MHEIDRSKASFSLVFYSTLTTGRLRILLYHLIAIGYFIFSLSSWFELKRHLGGSRSVVLMAFQLLRNAQRVLKSTSEVLQKWGSLESCR